MPEYQALVTRVIDGDTVELMVSLGLGVSISKVCRLFGPDPNGKEGLNAPEVSTTAGAMARAALRNYFNQRAGRVTLATINDREDKYGRILGVLYSQGQNVNQWLLDNGYAVTKQYDPFAAHFPEGPPE